MNMQQVITSEQAKKITKGRTPLVPVAYEEAVKALSECLSLDEAKYWDNKADALAAWAKIYRNDEALRKAKMLKLHAFRRMGSLATELRPTPKRAKGVGIGHVGAPPGPRSLLMEQGLSSSNADTAIWLDSVPKRKFAAMLNKPASPTTVRYREFQASTDIWYRVSREAISFRSTLRRYTPAQVFKAMTAQELNNAYALATEISEWLDEFEQRLPKVKP